MTCLICGAQCVCRNAGKSLCCSCHPHKARGPILLFARELAHAASLAVDGAPAALLNLRKFGQMQLFSPGEVSNPPRKTA